MYEFKTDKAKIISTYPNRTHSLTLNVNTSLSKNKIINHTLTDLT